MGRESHGGRNGRRQLTRGVKRRTQQRFVSLARRWTPLTRLVDAGGRARAASMLSRFQTWLPPDARVLDIGTGTGHVAQAVVATGRRVVSCDAIDLRLAAIRFLLCDGAALPFASEQFDAALLITVLHHVPRERHNAFLAEAMRILRIGGRLVVFEDTYRNAVERIVTACEDSVMNLEFAGHPHANRSLEEWRRTLEGLGAVIRHESEYARWYGPFRIRHGVLVADRVA
jgi:ubiquinone/menaquinone biosynthesis C-methylase UbiE